jgi:hypothetical protein
MSVKACTGGLERSSERRRCLSFELMDSFKIWHLELRDWSLETFESKPELYVASGLGMFAGIRHLLWQRDPVSMHLNFWVEV